MTRTSSRAEARFRDLIEKAADGVLVLRPDGVIVYANPEAGTLVGREPAELVGAMFGTPVVPGETTEIDLAQGQRVAELRAARVEWEGQVAALATLRDVTERRRISNALRFLADASKQLAGSLDRETTLANVVQLAVQHLADWCLLDLLEEDGKVRRLAASDGDPTRERLARSFSGVYELAAEEASVVCRVIRTGRPEVYARVDEEDLAGLGLAARHRDIVRDLGCRSVLVAPLVARGRALGAITFVSATLLRTYGEEELALAVSLVERAALALDNARLYDESREALRRRDEFLAMLAHELRNPLGPILTAARLMGLRGLPDKTLEGQRATIERQGLHLSRLLDDLLDLSRVTHGKIDLRKQPVDVEAVLRDALQAAGLEQGRRQVVTTVVECGPLVVEGDPTRLVQVLGNLLKNAARYTPAGGRIQVRAAREGEEAVVRVTDTGQGIPEEMLTRVFEPFVQVNPDLARSEGGLGIGLTLVRTMVELHGGRVTARSEGLGKGSTFEVRLPCSSAGAGSDEKTPEVMTPRRILLVEDNHDGREMLAELLRFWGHQVEGVGDGALALTQIRGELPDVALIDIGLPKLDGYRLAKEVRELPNGHTVLLLAVTGYGQPEDRARALAAGFDEHLVKPVVFEELARLLERGRSEG